MLFAKGKEYDGKYSDSYVQKIKQIHTPPIIISMLVVTCNIAGEITAITLVSATIIS